MESGYAILMFIFSGCILLYAALLYWTKDADLLPRSEASQKKGKKYVQGVAKVLVWLTLPPLGSGLVALRSGEKVWPALIILITGFVIWMWVGVKSLSEQEPDS